LATLESASWGLGQVCLTYLDYLQNGVDGIIGPGTRAALLAFRKANGISNNGAADDATLLGDTTMNLLRGVAAI
jgi:peptidoglycan hydrolase-like protein with peptidoglycan-binding domain